jgi:hypothetical protein
LEAKNKAAMKQNEIPASWSLCWSLLAVQRSVGMGNTARTFTSLTTLAAAAGCGTHVPRAFAALGYIRQTSSGGLWLVDPTLGPPDWDEVRAWIALQPGRAVKKTPPTTDIIDNRAVVEMAIRIHRAGYNVKVWREGGGGVTSLELKA